MTHNHFVYIFIYIRHDAIVGLQQVATGVTHLEFFALLDAKLCANVGARLGPPEQCHLVVFGEVLGRLGLGFGNRIH